MYQSGYNLRFFMTFSLKITITIEDLLLGKWRICSDFRATPPLPQAQWSSSGHGHKLEEAPIAMISSSISPLLHKEAQVVKLELNEARAPVTMAPSSKSPSFHKLDETWASMVKLDRTWAVTIVLEEVQIAMAASSKSPLLKEAQAPMVELNEIGATMIELHEARVALDVSLKKLWSTPRRGERSKRIDQTRLHFGEASNLSIGPHLI